MFSKLLHLGNISGEIFCNILSVVNTSTRGDGQKNKKVANYAQ